MYKKILFSFFAFILALNIFGQSKIDFPTNTITEKGAWCWFADPRAIHYKNEKGTINSTFVGYIDSHGNVKALQINHLTNTKNEVLIRSYFQPDDHNNPTFLVLPDERIMIFYSRHTDEPCFYYRISQKKGDITTLGREIRLETQHNTTYPSPFILSDDPEHIYLCWRGINWHPTIARLSLPDTNDLVEFDWGPYQIVRSKKGGGGVRPYAKYASNGIDKISLAYTTTHPDNQRENFIYYNYIDINTKTLNDVKGNALSTIGVGDLHDMDATREYADNHPDAVVVDTPLRNWLWETLIDKDGNPVIAATTINDAKDSHDYYYVKWNGNRWVRTFLSNAGGHFHQTPTIEKCYSAGMAIDKNNPQIIYASVPVDGKFGKIYELKKFTLSDDGDLLSVNQLTFDSEKNNVRPFMIANAESDNSLLWMYGDYYDWIVSASRPQGYPTAIRTNMALPKSEIDLKKDLLVSKSQIEISSIKKTNINVPKSKSFTINMVISIDTAAYHGNIVSFNGFGYSLPSDKLPKPCITLGKIMYQSSNVLGNSDVWQTVARSTNGMWYPPKKMETFQLAITYENGTLRTYINGLIDQYLEVTKLSLGNLSLGQFKGTVNDIKVYRRALSQDEVIELNKSLKIVNE